MYLNDTGFHICQFDGTVYMYT